MTYTLSKESSLRISLLSFPLIVGVVLAHTNTALIISGHDVNHPSLLFTFFTNLVTEGILRVLIPLFFLISGYLFFLNFQCSKKSYADKLKSRAKTLLVPFLFWNITTLGVLVTAQVFPATRSFFGARSSILATYSLLDYLNCIFGLNQYPIHFQFWFLRDLMAMIVLSPLIYLMIKRAWLPFLSVIFLCWFINFDPVYFPNSEAILFFSVGGWLSSNAKDIFMADRYASLAFLLFFPVAVLDALTFNTRVNFLLHKPGMLLGLVCCLFITKYVANNQTLKRALLWLYGMSFWVYATHEPALTICKKLIYRAVMPVTSLQALAIYLFLPVFVILASIGLRLILDRVAPRFTGIVTGGRVTAYKHPEAQLSTQRMALK